MNTITIVLIIAIVGLLVFIKIYLIKKSNAKAEEEKKKRMEEYADFEEWESHQWSRERDQVIHTIKNFDSLTDTEEGLENSMVLLEKINTIIEKNEK